MFQEKTNWIDFNPLDPLDPNAIPTAADFLRIESGIAAGEQGTGIYFITTNSGNNYAVTTGSGLIALLPGMTFRVNVNADATGNVTINIDGIGATNVLDPNGNNINNWKTGGIYTITYGATSFCQAGSGALISTMGSALQVIRMDSTGVFAEWGNAFLGETRAFGTGTTVFVAPKTGKYRAQLQAGGGGGSNLDAYNNGGGGGGYVGWTDLIKGTSYNVAVGAGGTYGIGVRGGTGGSTTFNGMTATGGQGSSNSGGGSGGSGTHRGGDGFTYGGSYPTKYVFDGVGGRSGLSWPQGWGGQSAGAGSDGYAVLEW